MLGQSVLVLVYVVNDVVDNGFDNLYFCEFGRHLGCVKLYDESDVDENGLRKCVGCEL